MSIDSADILPLRKAIDDIGAVVSQEMEVQTALKVLDLFARQDVSLLHVTQQARDRAVAIVAHWSKGPTP